MAVNTSAEIQAQMRIVEEARQRAVQEEKARLAKEQQYQQTIREAEQKLVQLQQRRAETLFSEVLAESDALVNESNAAVTALFTKLDDFIAGKCALADVLPLAQRVAELFAHQQAKHDEAMSVAGEVIATLPAMPAGHHTDAGYETVMRNQGVVRQHEQRINPAWELPFALVLWISQSRGDEQFRQRTGIVYAITGRLHEVDTKHLPTRESLLNALKERVSRFKMVR